MKDPDQVHKARGVDLSVPNYAVVGCEADIKGLTPVERERLGAYLDSVFSRDRAAFKKGWPQPGFRQQLTTEMNSLLGRVVVEEWSADLLEKRH